MEYDLLVTVWFLLAGVCYGLPSPQVFQEDPAVTNLRTYLRIPSIHPDPVAYSECVEWLRGQASEIGLDFHYIDLPYPDEFAVWMTWNGTDPSLKSVLLNSHMDVVPVDPEKWTHPPFDAYKDAHGNIYARGAIDMKSATVAELEAIRKLKNSGFQPLRTIHLTILPNEELGGENGMKPFVKTEQFRALNAAIDIDEGFPINSESVLEVLFAEKPRWSFNISAKGEASHASNIPEYTAGQRLQVIINKLLEYRQSEYKKTQPPNNLTSEDITVLNLVRLGGGTGNNIIPNEVWATFDMRILIQDDWNFTDVENMLHRIMSEAELGDSPNDITIEYFLKSMETGRTATDDSNVWWTELQNTCSELNITCEPHIFSAATDARFVRDLGIPVFGVNPFPNTLSTAHQDNEYINESEFLRGIDRYSTFIKNFAMLSPKLHP